MENELELIERIDKYLANELTSQERASMEELIASDDDIRQKVEVAKMTIDGLQDYELKESFKSLHDKYSSQTKTVSFANRYWISGIAASILLVIVSTVIFLQKSSNPKDLFAENFSPYPNIYTARGNSAESSFEKGISAYSKGDYSNAIKYFDNNENIAVNYVEYANFYKGLSLLATGEGDKAFPLFEGVQLSQLGEQAHWYACLSLLEQGEVKQAITYLKKIKQGQYKYDQAQEILDDLD